MVCSIWTYWHLCNQGSHPERIQVGRTLAGDYLLSIAKAVGHKRFSELVSSLILDWIEAECNTLCRQYLYLYSGRLRSVTLSATLMSFVQAPLLLQFQKFLVNKKKGESAHYLSILMAVAVILKERNREMCGVQSLISLLLFASHVDKQEFTVAVLNVRMLKLCV